ncbi:TolC family protein [Arcticibacter sp. MXS-1]|uniref:TolC family protein n=1 Tax=Arcticibacter sp. MXS-1 TaxID=3341726 RepID=UPI0035A976CD
MVLFVLIGQKATAQTGPLTLKDALNYALKYSETVKKARLDIEAGKAKTTEARSQALPQITGSGSISDNLIIQKTPLPGEILGRPGEYVLVAFSQKYNTSAQVQLSQQLFNQSVFTGLKAAKAGEEYYNLATGLSEENILQQVAAAYYQLLVTREKMAVLDSNINTLEKSQKIITNQFSNGLARKIDVDRIKVSLTNSQIQRLELSNALTQQENLLKFYMGMPIETKLDIPQTELNKIATSASALAEELNIENLKEYQLLRKQEQLLGYQRDARKAEYIPKLSFNTNFLYTGFGNKFDMFKNDGSTLWAKASAITVNLSVPIFDGFARRSRVKQAEIDVLKAREDIRNTTQSLKMANDNARRQIENSVKTINEQKENMRLAQEVYTSTQNNYNNGLATLTDLLDAENSLVTAQNSYTQALLNYKLAEIQLLKSNGNIKSLLN